MHFILIGLGSGGDVLPMVGLASTLARRGHRVELMAAAVFAETAARAGLPFIALGSKEVYEAITADARLADPGRALSVVADSLILPMMRQVYAHVAAHAGRDTMVLAPMTAFGARLAEEKLAVPLVTVHLQPALIRSIRDPSRLAFYDVARLLPRGLRIPYYWIMDRWILDPLFSRALDTFRREIGLSPVRRIFFRWSNSPRHVLGLFPPWFAPPASDWPAHTALPGFPLYDESATRPLPDGLEAFLDAGPAPVVFTAGTWMRHGASFFRESAEACRLAGLRGILLTQYPEQLPEALPEGVEAFDYIPFSKVLPRAAAIVHHGGIGTCAQAFASGIPQLVVPFAHDQPDNAVRVRRLGAGDFIRPPFYRAARVAGKLRALLSDAECLSRCRAYAARCDSQRTLAEACDFIEEAAGKRLRK